MAFIGGDKLNYARWREASMVWPELPSASYFRQSTEPVVSLELPKLEDMKGEIENLGSVSGGIHPRLPVKTDGALPRSMAREAVRLLDTVEVSSPVRCGQVILENIGGTGINFIAGRDM